jgi:hypothetical protein
MIQIKNEEVINNPLSKQIAVFLVINALPIIELTAKVLAILITFFTALILVLSC